MKTNLKNLIWIIVSCLMALSLVIASCDSKRTIPVTQPTLVTATRTNRNTEARYLCFYEPSGFDPYLNFMVSCGTLFLCNEELLMGDWTKTPAEP
jgi:hypothetical protein